MWLRPNVVPVIRSLYERGYSILVFTNQHQTFKQEQIKLALDTLNVPYKAYIMMDKAVKKPNPISFQNHIGSQKMSKSSFYVGDALGREQDWSDTDKVFAQNNNIQYFSPEYMFPFPKKQAIHVAAVANKETVIMVGYQGSGKSTFAAKHFGDKYTVLQGDILKTEAQMTKHLKRELVNGNSVVLDATNPSIKKRAVFIKIAKDNGATVRIVHIASTIEEALMNNAKRDKPIPKIAFYLFRKHYEQPTIEEGVEEVITVS
jgi:bifunctional polynucleotide phosphatase/kinase